MDKREQACANAIRAWVEEHHSKEAGLLATNRGYGYYTDPDPIGETLQLVDNSWEGVANRLGLRVIEETPTPEATSTEEIESAETFPDTPQ